MLRIRDEARRVASIDPRFAWVTEGTLVSIFNTTQRAIRC
jgi:hypothetical protein